MKNSEFSVDGFVDLVDYSRIKGWVICKKLPNIRAKISVLLNGIEITSGYANLSRPDLISVGIGVTDFSFALQFPIILTQDDLCKLRVIAYFQTDDLLIFNSEISLLPKAREFFEIKPIKNIGSSKEIKNIYYIVGPTSSGKTTVAKRLSNEMGLPVFHVDLIYNMLKDKYKISCAADKLTIIDLWKNPENFGIKSWGKYRDINDAKMELFEELLHDAKGDFIIEGYTLSLRSERDLVERVIGPHREILIRIDRPYEDWARSFSNKFNIQPPTRADYEAVRSYFSEVNSFKVAEFSNPEDINVNSVLNIPIYRALDPLKFITYEDFKSLGEKYQKDSPPDKDGNYVGYWRDLEDRWSYHKRVVEIMQQSRKFYCSALELGSMGISVVKNGHTIDYDKHINYYPDLQPHYIHDVRNIPWPIPEKYYDWFVALRVFHHLDPMQRQCFDEACRIARNIILVVPKELPQGGGKPISPETFLEWGSGISPAIVEDIGRFGMLYAWLDI